MRATETIDETGRVVWHARATLWGRTADDPDAPGHTPLRFPGQYHDVETGLHYNYRRYYDPTTGRYASADPLGLAAAPDPHSYVPNPTIWVDPLGLAGKKCETGDSESFYRGMSRGEYENQVRAQNSLYPLHGETFVTQDLAYIEQLAARHPGDYEVLVRFDMEPGTRDALLAAGARDDPASRAIRNMGLDDLPVLAKGNGQVHIKAELGYLNFGLRRDSVGIFNDRLIGHEVIREFSS